MAGPKSELRRSPSTSITKIATLEEHAARTLTGLKDGIAQHHREDGKTTPFQLSDDVASTITNVTVAFIAPRDSSWSQNDSLTYELLGKAGKYSINLAHRRGSNRGQ